MISVCMASYNGEKYIKEQIDSIICQLGNADELIISDDNSSDKTKEIILSYNDDRIKLLDNIYGKGPKANFETAIEHAVGDYVFLTDQDDIWSKNKVELILPFLSKYDLVVHDAIIINENKELVLGSYYSLLHKSSSFWGNLYKTRFLGCCMAFKREALQYILPFPKRVEMHDYWIGMIVSIRGRLIFIDSKLIMYRRHGDNFSSSAQKSDKTFIKKIIKRKRLCQDIIYRCLFDQN